MSWGQPGSVFVRHIKHAPAYIDSTILISSMDLSHLAPAGFWGFNSWLLECVDLATFFTFLIFLNG